MLKGFPDAHALLLYAIVAICGGVGGCAASSAMVLASKHEMARYFVAAYFVIGAFSAIIFIGISEAAWGISYESTEDVVLYSVAAGCIVPTVVFSFNWFSKIVFRYLGIEVSVTMRKPGEDRRDNDGK